MYKAFASLIEILTGSSFSSTNTKKKNFRSVLKRVKSKGRFRVRPNVFEYSDINISIISLKDDFDLPTVGETFIENYKIETEERDIPINFQNNIDNFLSVEEEIDNKIPFATEGEVRILLPARHNNDNEKDVDVEKDITQHY